MRVVGTGIPANTYVKSILSGTSVEMTQNATITGTTSVEFQDRLTIANIDFWGGSHNDAATNTFKVEDAFTPGDNIDETSLNLIQIINTSPTNSLIYAYYLSGVGDLPGQLLFK